MLVVEPADHERERFGHRGDVGRDIEGVRGDQQSDQPKNQPSGRDFHHVGGEAFAGDPADQGAHQLDRDHERDRQKDGPEQAITELRAGLRISGNPRWIIIGRTRHQSRTKQPKHHAAGGL